MTTIIVVLGIVASLKELFPDVGEEGVAVMEELRGLLRRLSAWRMGKERWRGSAVHHLKRRRVERRVI
jgi:hypothetical protein